MEIVEITKNQLKDEVFSLVKKANIAEQRWIYSYLNDLDSYPILIDHNTDNKSLSDIREEFSEFPEESERCPYD